MLLVKSLIGMLKRCVWKGRRLNCSSIFSMYPTDRGMCCTFNKQKADEMFKESNYQRQLVRLGGQDKHMSFEDSTLPDRLVMYHEQHSACPVVMGCFLC